MGQEKRPASEDAESNVKEKKAKTFSAREFRMQIKSEDQQVEAFNNFIALSKNNLMRNDCVVEYVSHGGTVLEILQQLDSPNLPQVLVLKTATRILLAIMKLQQRQAYSNATEGCTYFLSGHMTLVNKMLSLSSKGEEREIVLRLLTAIATLSPAHAKDVLLHVNFHTANLELLSKKETPNVREAFIKFLVAFLVSGNYPLILLFLSKKGLFASVVKGLQFDSAEVVCLFIHSAKANLLENPSISKTVKMSTFSTPVVRDLVNLYNWKGSKDELDKSKVSEAVHELLLMLCTSHKYGVIFRDRLVGLGKQHQNSLMFTVLESLERPWEHSYASDLVTRICGACPDLVKTMWRNVKEFLEPRDAPKWFNSMKFAGVLLEEIKPERIEFCARDLNPQQFSQVVQFLASPTVILKIILNENFAYDSAAVRKEVVKLLAKMLQATDAFLKSAKGWFSSNAYRTIKTIVTEHVTRNFPYSSKILNATNLEDFEQLETALEIFEFYESFDLDLLDGSLALPLDILNEAPLLQVKVIRFTLKHEGFDLKNGCAVLSLLLKIYSETQNDLAKSNLVSILINTGVFEGYESESDLWVNAVLDLKKYDERVGEFLHGTLVNCLENSLKYHEECGSNEFSPMILSAFECNLGSSKYVRQYFSFLQVGLFHAQSDFKGLLRLYERFKDKVPMMEYFQSWDNETPIVLEKIASKSKIESFAILSRSVLENQANAEIDLDHYKTLRRDLLQMCVFYLINLNENIDSEHLLSLTEPLLEGNFEVILKNSILLQKFEPLQNTIACTKFVIKVLNITPATLNYSNKFYNSLMKVIKKGKIKIEDHLEELLKLIPLQPEQCENLLKQPNDANQQFITIIHMYALNQLNKSIDKETINNLSANTNAEFIKSFHSYLQKFPDFYQSLPARLFENLIKQGEASLSASMLKNRVDLTSIFIENLDEIVQKKSLLLPLLDVAVLSETTLQEIYEKFEPSIIKALQKPHKAGSSFEVHNQAVSKLLQLFGKDYGFLKKTHKFESSEPFHAEILKTIFNKYVDESTVDNTVMTFVHLLLNLFKRKEPSDFEKVIRISNCFNDYINQISFKCKTLHSNESFKLFCKFVLKHGISENSMLLKPLISLMECLKFGEDEAEELAEMFTSHSSFLDVVLGEDGCKVQVLELWLALVKSFSHVMKREHVPVLLGSYHATCGKADGIILELLKMYESCPAQTNFYDFRPFLWGNAARNRYSIRADVNKSLWRQPKTSDVLDTLNETLVANTIRYYEHRSDETVYDLNFLLPLFSQLLNNENVVHTYKFTKSGALSIAIIALSSRDENMRKASGHILARFYYQLEAKTRGKDNLLWSRFIEATCKGVAVLENFHLNSFAAVFLARTALILTQPQHVMYIPLNNYLSAKSSPDLQSVPELYTLLHSSSVEAKEHKIFILQILRDGLRSERDFDVGLHSMAFKLLMQLYTVAQNDIKLRCLEVFKRACSFNNGRYLLCNGYGFLSWLHSILTDDSKILAVVIDIVKLTAAVNPKLSSIIIDRILREHQNVLKDNKVLLETIEILSKTDERFLNQMKLLK